MGHMVAVILSGITVVAGIYVALKYNNSVKSVSGQGVSSYASIAKTFQGS